MTIKVALHHRTHYAFDRPVGLSPHEVRLRPAAHCRTPIESYSLKVKPAKHFLNWQQDPYGNWVARLVFPEKSRELEITVDLVGHLETNRPHLFGELFRAQDEEKRLVARELHEGVGVMLSAVNTKPCPARLKIAVTDGCTTNRKRATTAAHTHPRS